MLTGVGLASRGNPVGIMIRDRAMIVNIIIRVLCVRDIGVVKISATHAESIYWKGHFDIKLIQVCTSLRKERRRGEQ
jgi:hypothetical protein